MYFCYARRMKGVIKMDTMTISFAKGSVSESSLAHNNRSLDKNFNFDKAGHEHIRKEETKNNVVVIHRDLDEIFDEQFEQTVLDYNKKQKEKGHSERQLKGITKEEKEKELEASTAVHDFLKLSKHEQKVAYENLADKKSSLALRALIDQARENKMTVRDFQKQITQLKKEKTYGQLAKEKFTKNKNTSLVHEFVIQVGDAKDFNETDANGDFIDADGNKIDGANKTPKLVRKNKKLWQDSKKLLVDYAKQFEKRNKNLIVLNAVVHMDEATPHLHLDVIPIGEGYKRGLAKHVSFNKALQNEGFKNYDWLDADKQVLKIDDEEATARKKQGEKIVKSVDSRKAFKDFRNAELQELTTDLYSELGISRKLGETNHLKDIHEYKEAQQKIETLDSQIRLKQRVKSNVNKQAKTAQKQRDNAISARNKANNDLADIQAQAKILASWVDQQREEKKKFEEKLKKEKVDQEKALQERKQQLDQREKYVESNENSFRKLFHQFKENYMLAGLEDLDDNFKRQNDIYEIANNWADVNSNSERAKNAEKAVFDKHPQRKIKAFLTAITSVFGRVNNIDTALDAQQDAIDEQKADQSKQQTQQKQDIDIDDDN